MEEHVWRNILSPTHCPFATPPLGRDKSVPTDIRHAIVKRHYRVLQQHQCVKQDNHTLHLFLYRLLALALDKHRIRQHKGHRVFLVDAYTTNIFTRPVLAT